MIPARSVRPGDIVNGHKVILVINRSDGVVELHFQGARRRNLNPGHMVEVDSVPVDAA